MRSVVTRSTVRRMTGGCCFGVRMPSCVFGAGGGVVGFCGSASTVAPAAKRANATTNVRCMVRLYPAASPAAGVSSDQRTQGFEYGFILLQRRGHLFRSDPGVGIQTFGLGPQFFPDGLLERFFRNPGHHLGVPRAKTRQPFGAEAGVAGF